jgi:hypothetical protein
MNQKKYFVQGRLWLWGGGGKGSWHFLTIDPDTSRRIRVRYREFARGWGSLPVSVEFAREAGGGLRPRLSPPNLNQPNLNQQRV